MSEVNGSENNKDDLVSDLDDQKPLAEALSLIAAFENVAVPAHRFSYLTTSEGGAEFSQLPMAARSEAMWKSRFPGGEVKIIDQHAIELSKENELFPLIWIGPGSQPELAIVRGKSAEGYVVEIASVSLMRSVESVEAGVLLKFLTSKKTDAEGSFSERSAKTWFYAAIDRHKRIYVEAILASLMISVFGLMSALYTMQVYDRVVPTDGVSTLVVLTIGVLLAIALEWTMKLVRSHMVNRANKSIDLELSGVFFGKALSIRSDLRPKTVGTFAAQIRQFEQIRNFMTSFLMFALADVPFALLFIGVISLIGGVVALVPLLMLPVAILVGLAIQSPIERLTKTNLEESNKKNGLLIEAIDGIESVKAVSSEWKLLNRWRNLTKVVNESELKTQILTNISSSSTQSVQQLSYVGIVAVGALEIMSGNLTMGGLIACSIISGRALTPLAQIPSQVVQWKHAKISLAALDGIMAMPDERQPNIKMLIPRHAQNHLRFSDCVFGYDEAGTDLEISELIMRQGERIAILGAVGSGKSTLIKIAAGLYPPRSGTVCFDELDVWQIAPEFVRERIGYLPQDVRLFNGTLRDNLVLGLPQLSDERILHACALTGLNQVVKTNPRGLEIEISEGGKGLSGGQRQLVGLTRLLLAKPGILLLDEPTASMDTGLETSVMKHLFAELSSETLIVAATHKANVLNYVDRIIVLEQGRILHDGPKKDVLEHMSQARVRRQS